MGQVTWTAEDRYFQGLCGNELYTETPADNVKGPGCYVCIWPFPGSIPENDCSVRLLPDPTHTYILKQAAPFTVGFSYPTATMAAHTVNDGATNRRNPAEVTPVPRSMSGSPSHTVYPGVVTDREFYSAGVNQWTGQTVETYRNLWDPTGLWLTSLLNSLVLDKVSDYIVPTSRYWPNPTGGFTASNPPEYECYWSKEFVTQGTIQSTSFDSTEEALQTGWTYYDESPAGAPYRIPPYRHSTKCQFYDRTIGRAILRISARCPTYYPGGNILANPVPIWGSAVYSVSVIYLMTHQGWLAPSNFATPPGPDSTMRGWGKALNGTGTGGWSWGSEDRSELELFPVPFGPGYFFPKIEIQAMYKYTAPDLATFMSLEDFTCDLQTQAESMGFLRPFSASRKIDAPTGSFHTTQYALMIGPEYQQSDGTFHFWGAQGLAPTRRWSCDHLLTLPSSVVISRLDVTPGS